MAGRPAEVASSYPYLVGGADRLAVTIRGVERLPPTPGPDARIDRRQPLMIGVERRPHVVDQLQAALAQAVDLASDGGLFVSRGDDERFRPRRRLAHQAVSLSLELGLRPLGVPKGRRFALPRAIDQRLGL